MKKIFKSLLLVGLISISACSNVKPLTVREVITNDYNARPQDIRSRYEFEIEEYYGCYNGTYAFLQKQYDGISGAITEYYYSDDLVIRFSWYTPTIWKDHVFYIFASIRYGTSMNTDYSRFNARSAYDEGLLTNEDIKQIMYYMRYYRNNHAHPDIISELDQPYIEPN